MNRKHVCRVAAFAFLAAVALGSMACTTVVGVGYAAPVYGGWGGAHVSRPYGGSYGGGPMWP